MWPKRMNRNSDVEGIVFDIQHFSVHDGPGIRTNIFLKGCPLRCRWCSNPESQHSAPQITFEERLCIGCGECARRCRRGATTSANGKASVDLSRCAACGAYPCLAGCYAKALKVAGRRMTVGQVITEALKDRDFYGERGGVTFTGGEPFSQPVFLAALAEAAKENGLSTAVESCLCVPWDAIAASMDRIDFFLCDMKHVDADKLYANTGADWTVIRANLSRLAEAGRVVIGRVPVIPGFNDTDAEVRAIASHAASLGIREIHLLPYHALGAAKYAKLHFSYPMAGAVVPDREKMARLRAVAEECGLTVSING